MTNPNPTDPITDAARRDAEFVQALVGPCVALALIVGYFVGNWIWRLL